MLASSDGRRAWDELATHGEQLGLAVHVFYADVLETPGGTVVTLGGDGGIEHMKQRMPTATFTFFRGAGHSIHGTQRAQFDAKLREVIGEAAAAGTSGRSA